MSLDAPARATFARMWDEAPTSGLWAAPWRALIDDLSPQQAVWVPAPDRHSIWQIVLHMIFWREAWLQRAAGAARHTEEEQQLLNFPDITDISDTAWAAARQRFNDAHTRIAEAVRKEGPVPDSVLYLIPHDSYHIGQIAYLRALQGLPPVD